MGALPLVRRRVVPRWKLWTPFTWCHPSMNPTALHLSVAIPALSYTRGIRCGDGGDVGEFAADGYGDNLAAVSRLMSEVWRGKFNAVRIKELEFPCVNQVRPPLMANNTRRTPRSIASRIDAADHAYLKASRGLEFQCRLAPSCRIPEVTKM